MPTCGFDNINEPMERYENECFQNYWKDDKNFAKKGALLIIPQFCVNGIYYRQVNDVSTFEILDEKVIQFLLVKERVQNELKFDFISLLSQNAVNVPRVNLYVFFQKK